MTQCIPINYRGRKEKPKEIAFEKTKMLEESKRLIINSGISQSDVSFTFYNNVKKHRANFMYKGPAECDSRQFNLFLV